MSANRDQALALAGVAQFALYAHELASEGVLAPVRLQRALDAIFCTDPDAPDDVFHGVAGAADGRRFLRRQLDGSHTDRRVSQVPRYIGQILRLSSSLLKNKAFLEQISSGIERAKLLDEAQAPRVLDETYQQTISKLKPRIMIQGQPKHLDDAHNAERIRTLLLAAVRCAILWRQSGGSFWRLLLQRSQLSQALAELDQERPAPRAF